MTKLEAKKRIEKLKSEIDRYRTAYHVHDKSLISDEALDSLKKELFDLETEYPELITPDSPTQRVGGSPLPEFKKVRHMVHGKLMRMNSLNDAFSEDDMRAWLTRLENYLGYCISGAEDFLSGEHLGASRRERGALPAGATPSPQKENPELFYCDLKMDGLAIQLTYKHGLLVQAETRGDGEFGEDVTQNIRTIDAIPLRLEGDFPEEIAARGEVVLTKKEFDRINSEQKERGEKLYANPRNLVAGSIRQLDPKITASRKLDFFGYGIVGEGEDYSRHYPSREAEYKALNSWGVKTNKLGSVARSLEEVFAFHEEVRKKREKIPFEIDGIVVTVNDNRLYERGGVIGKAPRASIAYKFSPREATTVVEDIKVQVGRTGVLTPVAVMKPVNVGGVTVTHATLHNADEIERLGLKIGDTVIVSRAGDVIPQVMRVLKELRTGKEKAFKMPEKCPVDGSKVVRDAMPAGRQGVAYRCSSQLCGARHRESLQHFVARGGFNIEGMGPKILNRFLDEGLIVDAPDIFLLKEGDIATLERFGEKSAKNLIEEIESKKRISLPRLIYALGIMHVGEETAALLAQQLTFNNKHLTTPKDILVAAKGLSLEQLQEVSDIGPKVAQSIYDWFHDARNIKLLEKLNEAGIRVAVSQVSIVKGQLFGKRFVLTGTLESMSREQAKERIRALGGKTMESVSKETDYVVAGTEPGSKYERGKKLGVAILDEKEFLKLLK